MTAFWDWLPLILSITGILGVGGVLILLGFWPMVSSFLIGTKLGRGISAAGAVVLMVFWAFISGKRKGAVAERGRQKARNYKIVQGKVKIDANIRKLTPAKRRARLQRWVRK